MAYLTRHAALELDVFVDRFLGCGRLPPHKIDVMCASIFRPLAFSFVLPIGTLLQVLD